MAEGWRRLEAIVADAAELEPHARGDFLAKACADDAELLRRARALLEAGLAPDGFLAPLLGGEVALPPGARVGPFRLVREVARGGMGTVFEGAQEEPRRRVAVKVLHDPLLAPDARRRFRYEIDALAALSHPGIAAIHQAGVHRVEGPTGDRELPWFAMEYVEGARTVTAYAEAEGLGRDARIELLVEIARAVHHGHQKGVIHRDLKPDNLLVDDRGRPRVIDFGVARVMGEQQRWTTVYTNAREIVGTLAYMSPEQVSGGPGDVVSDVYALGVVLYELLVGRLPIEVDARDFLTSARRIVEQEPARPSTVRPGLGVDVDAVLLVALSKDPQRRYASAAAFADDLERLRRGEPVEARTPGAWDRLRAFARRNRPVVLAVLAVVTVSVAAAVVSLQHALWSRAAERRAQALFDRVLAEGVETTFAAVPRVHDLSGGAPVASSMLERALANLQALDRESPRTASIELALAEAYRKLGDLRGNPEFRNLDDEEGAREAYAKALERAAPWLEDPRHGRQASVLTVRVLRKRARLVRGPADDEALRDLERAGALADRLVAAEPDDEWLRTHAALVEQGLAYAWKGRHDLERAIRHGTRAVERFRALCRDHPERVLNAEMCADAERELALVFVERQRFDEAAALLDRALARAEAVRPRSDRPTASDGLLAGLREQRGWLALRTGDFEVADALLTAAKDAAIARAEADPGDARLRVSACIKLIAWVLAADARFAAPGSSPDEAPIAARQRAREAAAVLRGLTAEPDPSLEGFATRLLAYARGELPAAALGHTRALR